jgi:uncharacterized RDD family membrane protein YckC
MPCPLCGDICRCSSPANPNANAAALPRWVAEPSPVLEAPAAELEREVEAPYLYTDPAEQSSAPGHVSEPAEDPSAWRQEVAARLNRYQARRKPRAPRYPSLRLRFEEEDPTLAVSAGPSDGRDFPLITTVSNQALALDSFASSETQAIEIPVSVPPVLPQQTTPGPTAGPTAKIIEFPRSWTPAAPPLDELAEPVFDRDRPRILEAPEVVPPLPALGGITIEPAQQAEMEKRPGIDIPLQSAPLARRILSAAIDGVIIAAACALFGVIFWKLTAIRPPRFQMIGLVAGLASLFWAAYQYLLLVYSGSTPGLRLARLELARFDGSCAGRRLRRWRVLASFLSAASLGMGYAWVFLDEDALCWHDRITHTYLAPKPAR